MSKNKPRVYWDENRECYYITFFEDTKCDEIVDAFEKFKGRKPKRKTKHDQDTDNKQRGRHETI